MIKKFFKTSLCLLLTAIIAFNSFCVGINDVNQYVTKEEYDKRVNSLAAKVNDLSDKKDADIESQIKKYFVKNVSSPIMAGGNTQIKQVGSGDRIQWEVSSGIAVWDGVIPSLEDLKNKIYKHLNLSDINPYFYTDETEAKAQYFYVRATLGAPFLLNQDENNMDASPSHLTEDFLLHVHFLNFEQFYIDANRINLPGQWTISYNANKKSYVNLHYPSNWQYLASPAKYTGWTGWHQNDNGIISLTKFDKIQEFETIDDFATFIEKLNPTHVPGRHSYIFSLKSNGTLRQAAPASTGRYIVEVVYLTPYAGTTTVIPDTTLFTMTAIPIDISGDLIGNEMFYSYYNGTTATHWSTMTRGIMKRIAYNSSPNTAIGERNISEMSHLLYIKNSSTDIDNWASSVQVTWVEVTSLPLYQNYLSTSKTASYLTGTISTSSFYLNMWYISFTIKTSSSVDFTRNFSNIYIDFDLFDKPFLEVIGKLSPLHSSTPAYTSASSTFFDQCNVKIDTNGMLAFSNMGYGIKSSGSQYTLQKNTTYQHLTLHLTYLSPGGTWYNNVAKNNFMPLYHAQVTHD